MRKKRGELTTSALYYAFIILIALLIIFWGYKSLKSFSSSSKNYDMSTFQASFVEEMETLSVNRGEIKELTFNVPLGYDRVCIFDNRKTVSNLSIIHIYYPFLKFMLQEEDMNVFLIGKKDNLEFKVNNLYFLKYPFYQCYPVKNKKFTLNAEGSVINGNPASIVKVNRKTETEVSVGTPITSAIEITSSDTFLEVKIAEGTNITNNPDGKISIEIVGEGEISESYNFEPSGTKFEPSIEIEISYPEIMTCAEAKTTKFQLGDNKINQSGINCDEHYVIFKISEFP